MVVHGERGDQIVHVEPVCVAGGEAVEAGGGGRAVHQFLLLGCVQVKSLPAGGHYHSLPYLRHEILLGIMEGHRHQIALLAHLLVIADEVLVDIVGKDLSPVHVAYQGVQVVRGISYGIKAAYQTSDTGAKHHIYRYLLLFQGLEYADFGRALGPAPAENQRDGGTVLFPPHLVHPLAHAEEHHRVRDGVRAGGRKPDRRLVPDVRPAALPLPLRPHGQQDQKNECHVSESSHNSDCFPRCEGSSLLRFPPARRAARRRPVYLLPGTP